MFFQSLRFVKAAKPSAYYLKNMSFCPYYLKNGPAWKLVLKTAGP